MTDKPRVRGSSVDRILACNASSEAPENPVNDDSEPARLGTVVHDILARGLTRLDGDAHNIYAMEILCEHELGVHGMSEHYDDAMEMIKYAWSIKDELDITGDGIERKMSLDCGTFILTGTADVGPSGLVRDWKTGRMIEDHPGQVMAYACLVAGLDTYMVVDMREVWLRQRQTSKPKVVTGPERQAFLVRLGEAMESNTYSPGRHCGFCPRRNECHARQEQLQTTAVVLSSGPGALTPQAIADLYDQSRALKRALDEYDKILDGLIEEHGQIELSDGRVLVHRYEARRSVRPAESRSVMAELGLTPKQMAECVKVSRPDILKAVRANLGDKPARGDVGQARSDAAKLIDAISDTKEIRKKVVKRAE